MKPVIPVLLAAGEGKRMHSALPKVLHTVDGIPMIRRVMAAAAIEGAQTPVVVVGHRADELMNALSGSARFALQAEQKGTGHAVMCASDYLKDPSGAPIDGYALVVAGDMPLLRRATLEKLVHTAEQTGSALTFLSAILDDPTGYGRVVRDVQGQLMGIVEQRDATEEQKAIHEVNTLVYCMDIPKLFWALGQLTTDNDQHEYYLTDCVGLYVQHGMGVIAIPADDADECLGVNDQNELARCDRIAKARHSREGDTKPCM